MQRDQTAIYEYLTKLFSDYLNPPSELATDMDGRLWKAANDLADEEKKPVARTAA